MCVLGGEGCVCSVWVLCECVGGTVWFAGVVRVSGWCAGVVWVSEWSFSV